MPCRMPAANLHHVRRNRSVARAAAVALLFTWLLPLAACNDDPATPATGQVVLDQQNLYDGVMGGQAIGRFSDISGAPDPAGTAYDLQDAQSFTAGISGRLARIRLPIVRQTGCDLPVELQLRELPGGVPDPDDGRVLGAVALPASAFAAVLKDDPDTWATFDVSGLEVQVTAGQAYCFSVRTADPKGFLYSPELDHAYAAGGSYRRNRAAGANWGGMGDWDYGFQVWVERD